MQDQEREKIKKIIEGSNIPEDLKSKELAILADENLSTPEVKMELAKLIAEEFDDIVEQTGEEVPESEEVSQAWREFEAESEMAEKDLQADMQIVDENLSLLKDASEEIQKAVLQADLDAKSS